MKEQRSGQCACWKKMPRRNRNMLERAADPTLRAARLGGGPPMAITDPVHRSYGMITRLTQSSMPSAAVVPGPLRRARARCRLGRLDRDPDGRSAACASGGAEHSCVRGAAATCPPWSERSAGIRARRGPGVAAGRRDHDAVGHTRPRRADRRIAVYVRRRRQEGDHGARSSPAEDVPRDSGARNSLSGADGTARRGTTVLDRYRNRPQSRIPSDQSDHCYRYTSSAISDQ